MVTGTAIAFMMGATPEIAASILPKSVTTPIAIAVSNSIGGVAAISAVCVIFVGILGAIFGHTLFRRLRVTTKASRGLAMGTASRPRYRPLRGRGLCGRRLQFTGINDLRDYYFSDGAVYLPGTAGIIRLT